MTVRVPPGTPRKKSCKLFSCRIFVLLEVNTPYPIGVINIKNRFVVAPYPIFFRYHNEESMTPDCYLLSHAEWYQ